MQRVDGEGRVREGGLMKDDDLIERYKPADRANHWLTAITFILLALSGLALFHPAFFFLTNLFGGGTWTRILHPYIGVVLAVSFYFLVHRFFKDNRSEEHTSELQSRLHLVCRLLLEKKNKNMAQPVGSHPRAI